MRVAGSSSRGPIGPMNRYLQRRIYLPDIRPDAVIGSDLQSLFGAPFGACLTAGFEPATVGVNGRCSIQTELQS